MAYNVPAIETFVNDINTALNDLIILREDLNSVDRLWSLFDGADVVAIRDNISTKLTNAKALVSALQVP